MKYSNRATHGQIVPLLLMLATFLSSSGLRPCNADDLQMEGFQFLKAKNYSQALKCYSEALKESPANSWEVWLNIGNCHSGLGQDDAALADFQKSIQLGGLHANQCMSIASSYQKLGDNKKAASWLRQACSLDSAKAVDPFIQASIKRLESSTSNPAGSSTAPDYVSSLIAVRRWPASAMPIKVFVRENPQVPGIYKAFAEVVRDSMDQWCKGSGGAISCTFVPRLEQATLFCDYTDKPEFVKSDHDLSVAATTDIHVRLNDNTIEQANIVCLVRASPTGPFKDRVSLMKVCLHELGHALGIRGHSPNNHDVMFSTVDIPTVEPRLSERDKNTIGKIYRP